MDAKELFTECCSKFGMDYKEFLSELVKMDRKDIEEVIGTIKTLIAFRDTTVGLWAIDNKGHQPHDLLHDFWQRSSDGCPLECTEAEKQETDFNDWINDLCFKIEY